MRHFPSRVSETFWLANFDCQGGVDGLIFLLCDLYRYRIIDITTGTGATLKVYHAMIPLYTYSVMVEMFGNLQIQEGVDIVGLGFRVQGLGFRVREGMHIVPRPTIITAILLIRMLRRYGFIFIATGK